MFFSTPLDFFPSCLTRFLLWRTIRQSFLDSLRLGTAWDSQVHGRPETVAENLKNGTGIAASRWENFTPNEFNMLARVQQALRTRRDQNKEKLFYAETRLKQRQATQQQLRLFSSSLIGLKSFFFFRNSWEDLEQRHIFPTSPSHSSILEVWKKSNSTARWRTGCYIGSKIWDLSGPLPNSWKHGVHANSWFMFRSALGTVGLYGKFQKVTSESFQQKKSRWSFGERF